MEEIRKMLSHVRSGLALDCSKKSTGVAIYRDGELLVSCMRPEIEVGASYEYGRRLLAFRQGLLSLLGDKRDFELVCIESALLGINSITSSYAYAVNYVIDVLLAEGEITCETFVRLENSSWKSVVRKLVGVEVMRKVKNHDKLEIIESFKRMGLSLAYLFDEFTTFSAYDKSGIQDRLDALGIMIGAIQLYILGTRTYGYKVTKTIRGYSDFETVLKKAKFPVERVSIPVSKLNAWYDSLKGNSEKSVSYVIQSRNLGRFGISHKLYDEFVLIDVKVVRDGEVI